MAVREFSLQDLGFFEGGNALVAFEAAMQRAVRDCVDRPREERVRKVNLQVEFTPITEADGTCDDLGVIIQVKETIPAFGTIPVRMTVRRRGSQLALVFTDDDDIEDPEEM